MSREEIHDLYITTGTAKKEIEKVHNELTQIQNERNAWCRDKGFEGLWLSGGEVVGVVLKEKEDSPLWHKKKEWTEIGFVHKPSSKTKKGRDLKKEMVKLQRKDGFAFSSEHSLPTAFNGLSFMSSAYEVVGHESILRLPKGCKLKEGHKWFNDVIPLKISEYYAMKEALVEETSQKECDFENYSTLDKTLELLDQKKTEG